MWGTRQDLSMDGCCQFVGDMRPPAQVVPTHLVAKVANLKFLPSPHVILLPSSPIFCRLPDYPCTGVDRQ